MLDFVKHGTGHGIVKATAGSGKTSTLVLVARELETTLLATGGRACFLAFNRATATELDHGCQTASRRLHSTRWVAASCSEIRPRFAALSPRAPSTAYSQSQSPAS